MLFKGTKKNAKEIAETIDNIGGSLMPLQVKKCTCYYTKTLDTHLDTSLDLLSDMFLILGLMKKILRLRKMLF